MKGHYLFALADRSIRSRGGGKAKNLRFLLRNKFPVPSGWVLSWDAHMDYQSQGYLVIDKIRSELSKTIRSDQYYAVRSSASVEDDGQFSYAGIFRSILQVKGIDSILESILIVWQSLDSEEFAAYRQNNPSDKSAVRMGVIIQEMVPAVISGVVFSKNPMTGLSETIIEAGQGTGDDQTKAKSDPECWISKWGCWIKRPEQGLINEELALEIIRQTKSIAGRYGQPVDLEWAYDGNKLHFLQVRPITRLDIPVFSNRISREMLPGIIKPLVWSVNTRLINQTWVDILIKLTGDHSFIPEELTGHFFYRAYFNISVFGHVFERLGMPYEALELLFGLEVDGPEKPHMRPGVGILPRLPRLLAFAIHLIWIEWQFKRMLQTKKDSFNLLINKMNSTLSPEEWLDLVSSIFEETKSVAYFNIIIPMLAMMHHRMLTGILKKNGIDARALELHGVLEATEHTSPHLKLDKLRQKYYDGKSVLTPEEMMLLESDLEQFMEQFGHFSDSGNDCSIKPWRETPELIRKMMEQPVTKRTASEIPVSFNDLKLSRGKRGFVRFIYNRTSRFAVHRETISSLYTFGYGQFRKCFITIGTHLVSQGVLESNEDVFYLYWQELIDLVKNSEKSSMNEIVIIRKQDIENSRDAVLPDMIFGTSQPPLQNEKVESLKGIPTSLGTYTGPARVLQSLNEFERLNNGDVLIIPYSDVGWTPLFARAGAVVAESGGVLSHSSIVAREYRIPAVVSVSGACRIADGTLVTVNGYTGDVHVST